MNGMLKRKINSFLTLLLICTAAGAQDIYTPVLQTVEANSNILKSYEAGRDASIAMSRTGLAPSDPEVSGGYLFGNPQKGNRKDIAIRQEFDFPSVYADRNKLSETERKSATYLYQMQRQQVLLEAKCLCNSMIYYNALEKVCRKRLNAAERIYNSYEQMLSQGTAGALEYNKAAAAYASAKLDYDTHIAERDRISAELSRLSGGENVSFDYDEFPEVVIPADFEGWWYSVSENHPALLYAGSESLHGEQQVRLAGSSALPKLSVGYMGEFVPGEPFQGVTAGISIPLWENKGKVKAARASAAAAKAAELETRASCENHFRALYARANALQSSVGIYTEALLSSSSDDLLLKAYDSGEISLLTYIQESNYIYSAQEQRLDALLDLADTVAELMSVTL